MSDRIEEIVRHAYDSMEEQQVGLKNAEIEALLSFISGVYPVGLDHLVAPLEQKLRAALPSPLSEDEQRAYEEARKSIVEARR